MKVRHEKSGDVIIEKPVPKKKYSSKNGYYKYYNADGISCRIKVKKRAMEKREDYFTIGFKHKKSDTWNMHIPNRRFRDVFDVIKFILKNLENQNMVFKVS